MTTLPIPTKRRRPDVTPIGVSLRSHGATNMSHKWCGHDGHTLKLEFTYITSNIRRVRSLVLLCVGRRPFRLTELADGEDDFRYIARLVWQEKRKEL